MTVTNPTGFTTRCTDSADDRVTMAADPRVHTTYLDNADNERLNALAGADKAGFGAVL